jgi:hypothetical protein
VSSQSAAGAVRAALSEVAKALGHEYRIALIEQLAQGPRSVAAVADRVGLIAANASQDLQQLRWNRATVQPFLDVRTAALNDTPEHAFRRRYRGFRLANDNEAIAAASNEPHSFAYSPADKSPRW